jgi:hypothetical protein
MISKPATRNTFKLHGITSRGNGVYILTLTRGDQSIVSECTVSHVDESKIGSFDIVKFNSDEFNDLCMRGDIYEKPIGKAILAFHACLRDDES